jgi:hypothetical protein
MLFFSVFSGILSSSMKTKEERFSEILSSI